MKRFALLLVLSLIAALPQTLHAQTLPAGLGVGGAGMGGQPINLQSGGLGVGGAGMGGQVGVMPGMMATGFMPGATGFVPGGAGMGGQGLSVNQYFGAMYMQSLAARNGRGGVRTGSFNPFANTYDPSQQMQQMQQMQQYSAMSLQQPKNIKSSTPKLTPEERKANIRMLAAERKAKAEAAARERKARAATAAAAKNAQK